MIGGGLYRPNIPVSYPNHHRAESVLLSAFLGAPGMAQLEK